METNEGTANNEGEKIEREANIKKLLGLKQRGQLLEQVDIHVKQSTLEKFKKEEAIVEWISAVLANIRNLISMDSIGSGEIYQDYANIEKLYTRLDSQGARRHYSETDIEPINDLIDKVLAELQQNR